MEVFYSQWLPPQEDVDKLVRKSSGQFIYAAVITYVCSDYDSPVDRLRS